MERMINQFSRSGRSLGWGRALLAAVAILGSALLPLPAAQASPGNGLDARVAALEAAVSSLQNTVSAQQKTIDSQGSQITALQGTVSAQAQQLQNLQAVQAAINDPKTGLAALYTDLTNTNNTLQEVATQANLLGQQVQAQQGQIAAVDAAVNDPKTGLAALQAAINDPRDGLAALLAAINDPNTGLAALHTADVSLQNQVEAQVNDLLKQTQSQGQQIATLNGRQAQQVQQLQTLQTVVDDPKTGLAALQAAINDPKNGLAALRAAINDPNTGLVAVLAAINDPNTGLAALHTADANLQAGLSAEIAARKQTDVNVNRVDTSLTNLGDFLTPVFKVLRVNSTNDGIDILGNLGVEHSIVTGNDVHVGSGLVVLGDIQGLADIRSCGIVTDNAHGGILHNDLKPYTTGPCP